MFVKLYKKILRRIVKQKSIRLAELGYVNHEAINDEIESYRKKGARIGKFVRLLGAIDSINPHLVSIGDYSVIGGASILLAHCPIKGPNICRVGAYTYLGYNVKVLPGVSIGNYCVIGAGSVVTRDVPDNSIAAGNPARVLRSLSDDEKKDLVNKMEAHKLFGWDPDRIKKSG